MRGKKIPKKAIIDSETSSRPCHPIVSDKGVSFLIPPPSRPRFSLQQFRYTQNTVTTIHSKKNRPEELSCFHTLLYSGVVLYAAASPLLSS